MRSPADSSLEADGVGDDGVHSHGGSVHGGDCGGGETTIASSVVMGLDKKYEFGSCLDCHGEHTHEVRVK